MLDGLRSKDGNSGVKSEGEGTFRLATQAIEANRSIVNSASKQDGTKNIQEHIILPSAENTEIESTDPRERIEKLIRYISKQSGIEIDEIKEGRKNALKYCKMWLALCLISREQDLEMNSIIDSFAS